MQVRKLIDQRANVDLKVKGMDYPPPEKKVKLAKFLQMLQVGFFGYVFAGDKVMEAMGAQEPGFLAALHDNKMSSFMFTWLFGNMFIGQLSATQAFEIYHGKKLIWSSLDKKRTPGMRDLIDAFKTAGVEFILDGPQ